MERHTDSWEVVETPPSYEVVRPRYFGLTPRGVVAAIAVVTLAIAVYALATGSTAVGLLLLAAAGLLTALYLEQARRRRESAFDRVATAAVDHTKAVAGFTGTSLRAWTGAGRELAKLRVQAHAAARERSQLQYALGGATFERDEAQVENLREQMQHCSDRIESCTREAQAVIERARKRTARERQSFATTEIRKP